MQRSYSKKVRSKKLSKPLDISTPEEIAKDKLIEISNETAMNLNTNQHEDPESILEVEN